MKKFTIAILIIAIIACSAFTLVACGDKADYKVGISQYLEHKSLEAAQNGFKEELTRLMAEKGKTVSFEIKNAGSDAGTNSIIANTLTSKKFDLLLGISTASAQALQGQTKKVPVLFTAVTDPVGAKLVGSQTDPTLNENVTGTSDVGDSKKQIELIKMLLPARQSIKLGILYTLTEINSQVQYKEMKAAAMADTERSISVVEKTINNLEEVGAAMAALNDCDIIYIPTDNKLAAAMPNVKGANVNKKPI
ncbi:MAG: ABC transporter substrate-binding protein, partial [Clostridia bacterium]